MDFNENNGQNKFEVHALQSVAKMNNYLPKMGQDATFARTLKGHNSVIFHPILTFDHTKLINSSRQIEFFKVGVDWVFFIRKPHLGNNGHMDQKPPQKCRYMS